MVKVSDYIMDFVADKGVTDVFGLAGGGCMHLLDSLGKHPRLKMIANLHEQCSAIGALGYSQYTERIGVALVTTGPGGTNALTGVAAAWIDSIPVMILSGQVKTADLMHRRGVRQMGPQEVDIVSMVSPITKYAVTVMRPEEIRYHLEKAFHLATTGRKGPVWIDIPLDIQGAVVEEEQLKGYEVEKKEDPVELFSEEEVYRLINQAQRPVLIAGNGVRLSGALDSFLDLVRVWKIPVLTTWKSVDFFDENDEFYFGRPGAIASRGANFALQNSDLMIAVGARLDLGQIAFDYKNLAPKAKKIIVDIDKHEIDKMDMEIQMKIVCDAGHFIRKMKNRIDLLQQVDRTSWMHRCRQWKKEYPVFLEEYRENVKSVNTYALVEVLSDLLTEDDVIVPGSSGSCSEVTSQAFRIKKGQRFINSPGLGSMGFGVAESIGVSIASKRKVVCLIGDGGLQHNLQELELLRRYNLPIKVFVLNNGIYASIRNMQNRNFAGHLVACDESSGLSLPDLEKITGAYDIEYRAIRNQINLEKQVWSVLNTEGPVICEVFVDPMMQTIPRTSSEVLSDGKIVSKPLEDLFPFLDREEFEHNMTIL